VPALARSVHGAELARAANQRVCSGRRRADEQVTPIGYTASCQTSRNATPYATSVLAIAGSAWLYALRCLARLL